MEDKTISEKESFQLITSMINKAKNSYHDTGTGAILWGTVITVCSLVQLSEIQFNYKLPVDIYWLTLIAIIPQIWLTIREKRTRLARSHNDSIMDYLWLAFGICIFLLILIINLIYVSYTPMYNEYVKLTGHEPAFKFHEFIMPLFLMLYGLPTVITGKGCRFKPMLWGGIICWVSCIIAVFTEYTIDLLLTAFSSIAAWFIPGLLMEKEYRRYKRNEVSAHV